jgi:hypothetical protein
MVDLKKKKKKKKEKKKETDADADADADFKVQPPTTHWLAKPPNIGFGTTILFCGNSRSRRPFILYFLLDPPPDPLVLLPPLFPPLVLPRPLPLALPPLPPPRFPEFKA